MLQLMHSNCLCMQSYLTVNAAQFLLFYLSAKLPHIFCRQQHACIQLSQSAQYVVSSHTDLHCRTCFCTHTLKFGILEAFSNISFFYKGKYYFLLGPHSDEAVISFSYFSPLSERIRSSFFLQLLPHQLQSIQEEKHQWFSFFLSRCI